MTQFMNEFAVGHPERVIYGAVQPAAPVVYPVAVDAPDPWDAVRANVARLAAADWTAGQVRRAAAIDRHERDVRDAQRLGLLDQEALNAVLDLCDAIEAALLNAPAGIGPATRANWRRLAVAKRVRNAPPAKRRAA